MSDSELESSAYYPMELQYIKALFLQARYLQCIRACRDILAQVKGEADKHPFQDTFVLFYTALSHDELARGLHSSSAKKTLSFDSAEQYYGEALASLPSADGAQAIYMIAQLSRDHRTPTPSKWTRDAEETPRTHQHTSLHNVPNRDPIAKSSQPWTRNDSPMDRSGSPEALSQQEYDHVYAEPGRFYGNVPASGRTLQRDHSRMSLLDTPPRHNKSYSNRDTFQSDSYLRNETRRQLLPKLSLNVNRYGTDSAMSNRYSEFASPFSEFEEPVSPLGPHDLVHEDSPISPISPSTSTIEEVPFSPALTPDEYDEEFHDAEERFPLPAVLFQEQIGEMREQILQHMSRAQQAKAQTADAQKVSENQILASLRKSEGAPYGQALDQEVSEHVKDPEAGQKLVYVSATNLPKNERIRAGRLRNWQRQRFQPERYQELCEQALAEL